MPTAGEIRAVLREVTDPELGINIVDLGLVYGIEADGSRIHVTMTLTSPSCPFSSVLHAQVESALLERFVGHEVEVTLVWEPHWTPERMADDVRRRLGTQ